MACGAKHSKESRGMSKYLHYSNQFPSGRKRYVTRVLSLFPACIREWIWFKLTAAHTWSAGLIHNRAHQMLLVREAMALGRTPVLKPFLFNSAHNFGRQVESEWAGFFDLSASYVRRQGKATEPLDYILAKALFRPGFLCKNSILRVRGREVTPAENDRYALIIREGQGLFLPGQPDAWSGCQPVFLECQRLRDIGDRVVQRLGAFHALHYRFPDRGTHMEAFPRAYREDLSMDHLASKLANGIFPAGSKLYVLANIWNQPDYFDALGRRYEVLRYYDFPELRAFIDDGPNTFLLFLVEQYIWQKARKRHQVRWLVTKHGMSSVQQFGPKELWTGAAIPGGDLVEPGVAARNVPTHESARKRQ